MAHHNSTPESVLSAPPKTITVLHDSTTGGTYSNPDLDFHEDDLHDGSEREYRALFPTRRVKRSYQRYREYVRQI